MWFKWAFENQEMKFDCLFMELLLGGWLWELLYVFIYGASVEVIHRWTNIALLSIQDIAERLKKFKDETGKVHSGSESEDPSKDSGIYKVTPIRTMMNVKKNIYYFATWNVRWTDWRFDFCFNQWMCSIYEEGFPRWSQVSPGWKTEWTDLKSDVTKETPTGMRSPMPP